MDGVGGVLPRRGTRWPATRRTSLRASRVIVPNFDMLNREAGAVKLAWKLSDKEEIAASRLCVVHHGRTRKHCQLYGSYRDLDNEWLVLIKASPGWPTPRMGPQGSQVHEQAVRAHRLVAAGQPLEVPGGRDASQAGAEQRPDLPQLRLRQGDAVVGVAPGVV